MIERVSEGPLVGVNTFATNPSAFRLGLDGKAMSAPTANFRGTGSRAPWNGSTDKRSYGIDDGATPPPPPSPPQGDSVVAFNPGPDYTHPILIWGSPFGARGRVPKEDSGSIVPPPPPTSGPPPINRPPDIPPPSVDPGDVGHDTDDNIDDLTDLFRETFTGTPSGGGAGGGGASILPTTIQSGAGGGGSSGGGLVTVLVLLALGAAVFFGYRWYKKRKAAQS